jgi:hypothetical protein
MQQQGTREHWYSSPRIGSEGDAPSGAVDGFVSVRDRTVGRLFAIGFQLERALDLSLNPMVRQRIDRALSEADEAIDDLRRAGLDGQSSFQPYTSKVITVHPDAWNTLDHGIRGAYKARAAQLGVTLEVGDTGIPNRNLILVLDKKAE